MVIDQIIEKDQKIWPEKGFLNSRLALVTGGARRIGKHLAMALAEQGTDIVLHYNFSDFDAQATADVLRKKGVRVELAKADLSDPFLAEDLVYRASETMGRPVDILINNAALFSPGSAMRTSTKTWDEFQTVNLHAPFLMARTMAASLPEGDTADVINLNDFKALQPTAENFGYTMSKWGLHGLTRNLALALAPRVRVNELALGAVLPPDSSNEEYVHTTRDEIPIQRFVTPQEVASAMLFLLANEAITGQTLNLDGGQNLFG